MKTKIFKILFLTLIITAIISTAASCISFSNSTKTPTATTPKSPATTSSTWTAPTANSVVGDQNLPNIADVVAAVKPSVVAINTISEVTGYDFFNGTYTQQVQGAGSGWIIDKNGIIVTNNHVVEGAKTIVITMADGTTYTTDKSAVFTDPLNDLAIIKIKAAGLPALKVGNAAKMRVGDWVIAIGNALGQGIRASEGIISEQNVSLAVDTNQTLYDLLETSAAINPGNSGGPLVNLAGEVIGITSAKIASVGVESMGYAISIDTALPIIEELVNKGYVTRPWIGVDLYPVNQYSIQQLNLAVDKGVLVTEIGSGSPAETAGIKKYDVIVSMGGQDVTNIVDFTKILNAATIGKAIPITIWRGHTQQTTTITPAESPKPTG